MPDAGYHWTGGAPDPGAWAARIALVRGLYTRKARKAHPPVDLLARTLTLWRLRLAQLRRLEWPRLDGVNFQYTRNCPPFPGPVEGPPGFRRCRLRQFCPWCYALDVATPALRSAERGVKRGAARIAVGLYRFQAASDKYSAEVFLHYVRTQAEPMAKAWKAAGALGGVVLWTAAPSPFEGGGTWRGLVRVLLALPADPVPAESGPLPKAWRVWNTPDRRACCRAAGMFAVYPGGLLTGPPEDTLALLAARGRCRALRTFGTLYG